jgi:uncharacterized protein (TIGR00106 family)
MVLLEFSIAPIAKGESVSADVARALDIVDRSGLPYQTTSMGTIIEGDWDETVGVVTDCFKAMAADNNRVVVNLRVDYRANASGRLKSKIDSVEKKLGRRLST